MNIKRNIRFLSVALAAIAIFTVSCKKDNAVTQTPVNYPLPSSYSFAGTDSNAARVTLSMVSQMEAYITTGNGGNVLSASQLKAMLGNTGGYFRDTTVAGVTLKLNAATTNLKSMIAPLAEAYVETIFDSAAVASQSTKAAANGTAGISTDKKTLLSANGVYWRQLFTKTIMGVLLQHLTTDTYLTDSLNSSISVAAKTHAWDQAFFLWTVPINFPANRAGVKYWGSYSSQIDSGVNKPVVNLTGVNSNPALMTAFLNGRVALNNNDLFSAQTSAATIIAIYEKMEAAAALHELNEAIGNIPNGASSVAGNVSESMGFINAWKYNTKRKIATDAQVAAIQAMYGTNFYNLTQANLESIKTAISAIYGWDAVKAFL